MKYKNEGFASHLLQLKTPLFDASSPVKSLYCSWSNSTESFQWWETSVYYQQATVYIKILCTSVHTHFGLFFLFFLNNCSIWVLHVEESANQEHKKQKNKCQWFPLVTTKQHFEHALGVPGVFFKLMAFSKPVLCILSRTIYLKKHSSILCGCTHTCHFPCLLILHAIMWAC